MAVLSYAENLVLTIVPKIVAFLSAFGSGLIISQILRNKPNIRQFQQQIVLGMSIIDATIAVAWILNNLFIPEWSDQLWPLGNEQTCSAQGFVIQFTISAVLYNATLSVYYLLVVKFNYRDRRLNRWRRRVHILPISFGLATSLTALVRRLYNPADWDCWIAPLSPTVDCERYNICDRGQNAVWFQWAFFYVPFWIAVAFVLVCMAMVILYVRGQERKSNRWKEQAELQIQTRRNKKLRQVCIQSVLYVAAFLVTHTFNTITRALQSAKIDPPSWLIVVSGCFMPIQGLFNCLAYFHPRYRKEKAQTGNRGIVVAWSIVKRTFGCCSCQCRWGANCGKRLRQATATSSGGLRIVMQDDEDDIESLGGDSTADSADRDESQ
mmetsp:Transcript_28163/g.61883  ORF Transcript_28163/g.61883 Transcript_28163/m.61883 type:complete len:380 (+) Transcript_28163:81-1220(+)